MTPSAPGLWDSPSIHRLMASLAVTRGRFRTARMLRRLRSPRRMIATILAVAFFAIYVLNGVFILSSRQAADPARLQLWLSGGMVIYALYHFVRCVWSRSVADLEISKAEELWLGGGPIRRSSLAVYHIVNIVIAAAMKTFLLTVVLACDVTHIELMVIGIFTSLVLLEVSRLIIQRWSSGLSDRGRMLMRLAATSIAVAVGLQIICRTLALTPFHSPTWKYLLSGFAAIGETAASDTVWWFSLPWVAAAKLVVASHYGLATFALMAVAVAMVPLAIWLLVQVDAWAEESRLIRERQRFAAGDYFSTTGPDSTGLEQSCETNWQSWLDARTPRCFRDATSLMARQMVSIARYRGTILFSFAVPTLLCLSPLVTGQVTEQWFYVVGGIAMCTMLLAPPALRIDFRRDLKRMMLLRSLPVAPSSMVLGQLTLPVLITIAFQWVTILIAAIVTAPGLSQVILWGLMLAALAVFTFAIENALFLAYPHHERAEGIGMMIRAKLTFLGKAAVMVGSLACLVFLAAACRANLPVAWVQPVFLTTSITMTWIVAATAFLAACWSWRRFDLSFDMPPE